MLKKRESGISNSRGGGQPDTGKTTFLRSFSKQVLNCQTQVVKTADRLHHQSFFKGKPSIIILDQLNWMNKNMIREHILHLLS